MLETIRAYVTELLHANGEWAAARERHAEYYVGLAEGLEPRLRGPGAANALSRLAGEYDNLWAVLEWSSDSGHLALGLRLAASLYRFWHLRGILAEPRQWLDGVLMRASAVAPAIRAAALNGAGVLAGLQHEDARAAELFEESLALYTALGDVDQMARETMNLGLLAHNLHERSASRSSSSVGPSSCTRSSAMAGASHRPLGSQARVAHGTGRARPGAAAAGALAGDVPATGRRVGHRRLAGRPGSLETRPGRRGTVDGVFSRICEAVPGGGQRAGCVGGAGGGRRGGRRAPATPRRGVAWRRRGAAPVDGRRSAADRAGHHGADAGTGQGAVVRADLRGGLGARTGDADASRDRLRTEQSTTRGRRAGGGRGSAAAKST